MSQNSKNYKNKYFYKGSFYDLYHLFNKLVDDGIVVIYPGSPFIWLDLKGKSHYTRGGKSDLVNALISAGIVMHADDIIETALKRLNYIDENKIYCISENYLQDIKKIKALDIIIECFEFNGFDELIPNNKWFESEEKQDLVKEVLL